MAAVAAVLVATPGSAEATAPPVVHAIAPTAAAGWVWYYQRIQPSDAPKFAGARAVVTSDQPAEVEADAVATIHSEGALAFQYVDIFSLPLGRRMDGVDLADHPGWQFCGRDGLPLAAQVTGQGSNTETWVYPDLNERGMLAEAVRYLRSLQRIGYDGVFFDRGTVALGRGSLPHSVSTCTARPARNGTSFAGAFARVVRRAAAMGLHTVVNYGRKTLRSDVYDVVDRVMRETAPHADSSTFETAFLRRRHEEAAARGGGPRYIEELKTMRLGDRAGAFYEWAEGALWRIDLTINSGDDGCSQAPPGVTCWRYGTFPELTRVARGRPLDAQPSSRACRPRSRIKCLWLRRWQYALVVVNETRYPIEATIASGHPACRVFTDVWSGGALAGGACTMKARVSVPPLSGRVFTEARGLPGHG